MKREVKKFRKEYDELVDEFLRKMNHHYSRLLCKFLNDSSELHNKLHDLEQTEIKGSESA